MDDLVRKNLARAYRYAKEFSDDLHTKNGAILIKDGMTIGEGANEIVTGPNGKLALTGDELQRPHKYTYLEHAERNAVFQAIQNGRNPYRATLYCPWFSCEDCSRVLIHFGIKEIYGHQLPFILMNNKWQDEIAKSHDMMQRAGIQIHIYQGKVFDDDFEIIFNNQIIRP